MAARELFAGAVGESAHHWQAPLPTPWISIHSPGWMSPAWQSVLRTNTCQC